MVAVDSVTMATCLHGTVWTLDRGSCNFMATCVEDRSEDWECYVRTATYHPQSGGLAEHWNRTLLSMFAYSDSGSAVPHKLCWDMCLFPKLNGVNPVVACVPVL